MCQTLTPRDQTRYPCGMSGIVSEGARGRSPAWNAADHMILAIAEALRSNGQGEASKERSAQS